MGEIRGDLCYQRGSDKNIRCSRSYDYSPGGTLFSRDVMMEIEQQIASSVLTGLQTAVVGIPSSSSGQVDRASIIIKDSLFMILTRAIGEFC